MSMGHLPIGEGPLNTARAAWACCPRGTPAMWMRDNLRDLLVDNDFVDWFPEDGRIGIPPAKLASALQYAENLTDRQGRDCGGLSYRVLAYVHARALGQTRAGVDGLNPSGVIPWLVSQLDPQLFGIALNPPARSGIRPLDLHLTHPSFVRDAAECRFDNR